MHDSNAAKGGRQQDFIGAWTFDLRISPILIPSKDEATSSRSFPVVHIGNFTDVAINGQL
jgi:hypothetical protein